jgi:hypothetical protein
VNNSGKIFWVGDQATCDGRFSPTTGSFLHENNWLNYVVPGSWDDVVFEIDHETEGGVNNGTVGSMPRYIYFGDFLDRRSVGSCNDNFVPGGDVQVAGVEIRDGEWTFDFRSPEAGTPRSLEVWGRATVAATCLSRRARLDLTGGTMTVGEVHIGGPGEGHLHLSSSATLISPTIVVAENGRLTGPGTIIGNVHVMKGTVNPGPKSSGSAVGGFATVESQAAGESRTLVVDGDFQLYERGALELEVEGTEAATDFDQFSVTGNALLENVVTLVFRDGFAPNQGDEFDFVQFDTMSGSSSATFETVNLLPGFNFETGVHSNWLTLTALNNAVFVPTLTSIKPGPDSSSLVLRWISDTGLVYSVERATGPAGEAFSTIASNLLATSRENTWTTTVDSAAQGIFRLNATLP